VNGATVRTIVGIGMLEANGVLRRTRLGDDLTDAMAQKLRLMGFHSVIFGVSMELVAVRYNTR
jgi:hypothetical protein